MKKLILGSFAVFLACGAFAQSAPPAPTVNFAHFSQQVAFYRWGSQGNYLVGPWQNGSTAPANWLTGGGDIFLGRSVTSPTTLELWIDGQRGGRITQISSGALTTQTTLIHSTEDSSLTGKSTGMGPDWPWGEGHSDNALTIGGSQMIAWNVSLGKWILDEGNYIGGGTVGTGHPAIQSWLVPRGGGNAGVQGGYFDRIVSLSTTGTSFYASSVSGSESDAGNNFGGNGLYLREVSGITSLKGVEGKNECIGGDSGSITYAGAYEQNLYSGGGEGAVMINAKGSITISDYDFYGGGNVNSKNARSVTIDSINAQGNSVYVDGGAGLAITGTGGGTVSLTDGKFIAGSGGRASVIGPDSSVATYGGAGAYIEGRSTVTITGDGGDEGIYSGGRGGSANLTTRNELYLDPDNTIIVEGNGTVWANGGSGLYVKNSTALVIDGITATGNSAGSAFVSGSNSTANATAGHGLLAIGTATTIHSGTFTGADGGSATAEGYNSTAEAYGGAGAMVSGGSLTINGGTFTGGSGGTANGEKQRNNVGVWVVGGDLTINQATNTVATTINGDVLFDGSATKALNIKGGTITGDIIKTGNGTTTMTVSDNASFGGSFLQEAGTVNVNLSDSEEAKFFGNVNIGDGAELRFKGADAFTAEGASFTLASSDSTLASDLGLTLSQGAKISAGYGTVIAGGDLIMEENARISLSYDGLADAAGQDPGGSVELGGNSLDMSDPTARIVVSGIAATSSGSFEAVTGGTTSFATNEELMVQADLGWLVNETIDGSAGIVVNWDYNSLTNSSLSDLDHDALLALDAEILTLDATNFYRWNNLGDAPVRYSMSQMPDTAEESIKISRQLNQQLANRGTEFRSMNGFASTKPGFGQPTGAAGPEGEKTMQGWVRAYGSVGDHDQTDAFAEYDSSSWGTVIGVDKSFGNLLIGLAGGYASSELDGGTAYMADVDTYHGSIYSTIGGESVFVDLALTYGVAETEERNALTTGKFDSDMISAYIGAGKRFDIKEKVSITPEASLLSTFYTQEEFDRTGLPTTTTLEEYDTESFLGSLGVSLATLHEMDWLNQGVALVPEVRLYWLHEFNADPGDLYIAGTPYAVRPRDEDLLRLGFGFDLWHGRHENVKFEIDYDGLFSDTYSEHIFSGKAIVRF